MFNINLLINEIPYSISSRLNYSGVNALFFLKHYAFGFDFFIRSQFALKPLGAIQTKLYPYFDTNKNLVDELTLSNETNQEKLEELEKTLKTEYELPPLDFIG